MSNFENFRVHRGEDGLYSGSAQRTITGFTINLEVRHRFDGASGLILNSTLSGNITITGGPSGKFTSLISASNTAGLPFGAHAFQARRVDSGSVLVLTEGYMNLLPSVGI